MTDRWQMLHHEITAATVRLRKCDAERPGLARAKLLREPNAAKRLEAADRVIAELHDQLARLRIEVAELEQAERAKAGIAAAREAAARPALIVQLREAALMADDGIDQLAAQLREALDRKHQVETELDRALDSRHFSRTRQALLSSIPSTLAKHFVIDRSRPWNQPGNSLLGLTTSLVGAEVDASLRDRDIKRMDDLVRYFANRDDAAAAQARLQSRGDATVALELPDGVWILLPSEAVISNVTQAYEVADATQRRGDRAAVFIVDGVCIVADPHLLGAIFGAPVPRPAPAA